MKKIGKKWQMKAGETRADIFEKIGGSGGGSPARLQSNRSGPNTAGNARHKVERPDLGQGFSGKADPKFMQKQKKQGEASAKRVKKAQAKEKASSKEKRAKRDKELEDKIGKKGLKEAQKAYKGLYGDWNVGGRTGIVKGKAKPKKSVRSKRTKEEIAHDKKYGIDARRRFDPKKFAEDWEKHGATGRK
jgi:hypothetical protein